MMLRKHPFLLTACVIAALMAFLIVFFSGKPHYPVVRAIVKKDAALVFIGNPWNDAERCNNENEKVTTTLRQQCPQCVVALAECRDELIPSWMSAFQNESGDLFFVRTETQHIIIEADKASSKDICIAMAEQINSQKKQRAECIFPRS